MNSKAENSASGLHKGQNHSDNVVRGGGSEGRSSWCRSKPLEAVFFPSPMPAGGRGREHQREDRAGSRGAKRLPQPEQLRPNFPIAEMNTRERAAEQTQSAHPAAFGRERTELEQNVTARTQSSRLSHHSCLPPTFTLYPKALTTNKA